MIPSWAPNVHPLLVHFPIAILILAFVFDILAFFVPEKWWNPTIVTLLYAAGAIFAAIAYFSGQAAENSIPIRPAAEKTLQSHSELALYTLLFFAFYVTIRLALTWDKPLIKRGLHTGLIIAALAGLCLLYLTADYGGKLVYGYGTGTGQLLSAPDHPPAENSIIQGSSE